MEHIQIKKGDVFERRYENSTRVVITSPHDIMVVLNGKVQYSLPTAGNAVFQFDVRPLEEVSVWSDAGEAFINVFEKPLSSIYDPVDPESMVEIVTPSEMNIYDRLRSEMLTYVNQIADKKGFDTIDEADDLDFPDDDENDILTPYEAIDMAEEYPVDEVADPTSSTLPPDNSGSDEDLGGSVTDDNNSPE